MTTKVHVIAIAVLGLTLLGVTHAAASIYDDCSIACADECSWMKPRRCRRTFRKCVRKGVWVCGGLPTTTTTSSTTSTTTTLPGCYGQVDCGNGYCCPYGYSCDNYTLTCYNSSCAVNCGNGYCCPYGYYCDNYTLTCY